MGFAAPICARYVNMVTGNKVTAEVFSTKKRICALLAVSLNGLSFCNSCMALMPRGVAALSSPNALADIFITIAPIAGWFLGTSGIRRINSGLNHLVIT